MASCPTCGAPRGSGPCRACGAVSQTTPPRRDQSIESPPRDVGDATRERVRELADGWSRPDRSPSGRVPMPTRGPTPTGPAATVDAALAAVDAVAAEAGDPTKTGLHAAGAGVVVEVVPQQTSKLGSPMSRSREPAGRAPAAPPEAASRAPVPGRPPLPSRESPVSRSAALRIGSAGASSRQASPRPADPEPPPGEHPRTQFAPVVPVPSSPPAGPDALPSSPSVRDVARAIGGKDPIEPRATPLSTAPRPGAPARLPAPSVTGQGPPKAPTASAPPARPGAEPTPLGAPLRTAGATGAPPPPGLSHTARPAGARPGPPSLPPRPQPIAPPPEPLVGSTQPPHGDPTTAEKLTYGGLAAPQRGIVASLRYTAHVTLYSARRFKLLRELRADVATKQGLRAQRLHELALVALDLEGLEHRPIEVRRAELATLGRERSRREEEIVGLDASMASERDTFARAEEASRQRNAQIAEQMADLEGRLRPLERDHAGFERETNRLEQDAVQLQKRIATLEVKLGSAAGDERQRMAMELAGLKARREQIERDAPELEGRCSAIEPAIEALRGELEAAREEANANRRDLAAQDQRMRETVRDLEGQLANQRRELDRIAYDKTMAERALGDDLDRDRVHHTSLIGPYRAVDELGGTLTALEVRIIELEKEGAGLDRAAVRRSLIVLGAGLVLVIALVILLIVR